MKTSASFTAKGAASDTPHHRAFHRESQGYDSMPRLQEEKNSKKKSHLAMLVTMILSGFGVSWCIFKANPWSSKSPLPTAQSRDLQLPVSPELRALTDTALPKVRCAKTLDMSITSAMENPKALNVVIHIHGRRSEVLRRYGSLRFALLNTSTLPNHWEDRAIETTWNQQQILLVKSGLQTVTTPCQPAHLYNPPLQSITKLNLNLFTLALIHTP